MKRWEGRTQAAVLEGMDAQDFHVQGRRCCRCLSDSSLLRPPRLDLSVVRRERRIQLGRTLADRRALHGSLVHHACLLPPDLERGELVAKPSGLVREGGSERCEVPSQEITSIHAQWPTGRIAHHREHDPTEARDDLGRSRLSGPEPRHP